MIPEINLKTHLNQFFDRTQKEINIAKKSSLHLDVGTMSLIRQTIENAIVAYTDFHKITLDNIDITTKSRVEEIQTLVEDLEQKKVPLPRLAARAQHIANSLPFHKGPQLTGTLPQFVLRIDEKPICFKFLGSFEHALQTDYAPTLEFNNKKFTATHLSPHILEFSLTPSSVFPGNVLRTAKRITFNEGKLEIPWLKGSTKTKSVFRVIIGGFPPSPGTIELKYTTNEERRIERPNQNQERRMGSCKEDGNDDQSGEFTATPSPGWRIKKGSSRAQTSRWGDCDSPSLVRDNENEVAYHGATRHHRFGESGRMHVKIIFTEWKMEPYSQSHSDSHNIDWNKEVTFNHSFDEVILDAFDGSTPKLKSAGSAPYFKVEKIDAGFVIKPLIPTEIEGV